MAYNPVNPNGQATMANSSPVVVASNQSTIPTSLSSLPTIYIAGTIPVSLATVSTVSNLAEIAGVVPSFNGTDLNINIDKIGGFGTHGISDADGNPSATIQVEAFGVAFNGSTWDRVRSVGGASGATLSTGILATGNIGFYAAGGYASLPSLSYGIVSMDSQGRQYVNVSNSVAVTGSFWQTVQPVSLGSPATISIGNTVAVTGTFYQTTQPVSLNSLPTVYIAGTVPVSISSLPSIYGQVAAAQSGIWNIGSSPNSALGDATANPTTNIVGSMNELFNGTTWDRVRSVAIASGATGTGVSASGTLISTGTLFEPVTGNSTTTTNKLGMDVNILSVLGTAPTNAGVLDVDLNPQASGGGWAAPNVQVALTNSVVNIKTSAGKWGGYMFYNPNASAAYIQLFSVFASNVSLASYAQYAIIPLPAGAAANVEWTNGTSFPTALSAAATAGATGSTTPGTALTGFFLYK